MKRAIAAVILVLCFVSVGVDNCLGQENSVSRTTISFRDFTHNVAPIFDRRQLLQGKRVNINVPALMIYDGKGILIYFGIDAQENASELRKLPAAFAKLTKSDGWLDRGDIFSAFPGFEAQRKAIETTRRYIVLSLSSSERTPNCRLQQRELNSAAARTPPTQALFLEATIDMK